MGKVRKPYTEEELKKTAEKYEDYSLFRKNEYNIYLAIQGRGLLEKLCGHMKRRNISNEELAAIAKQYDSIKEFRANNKNAYNCICKRGLLNTLCAHMVRYENYCHSEEELADIAKCYTSVKEFRKKDHNIYDQIRRRGLLGELCAHMKRAKPEPFSDEELVIIAKDYDDLHLFKKEQKRIYSAIQRRGLLDKLCGHMKRMRVDCYSDDDLKNIAKKYKTKREFQRNDGGAYFAASKRGILESICHHMERLVAPKGFYTKEYCKTIAKDFKTRSEFQSGNGRVYSAAARHGWLDDICSHMAPAGTGRKRKVYVYTFEDGYAYVGLTDDISRRKREHLGNFRDKKKSPVLKHLQETGAKFEYKELTGWLDLDVVGQIEDKYIKQYAAEGWLMLNRRGGGGLGGRGGIYAPDKIKKIVRKYEYMEDFRQKEPGIYDYLCANHLYSKYCSVLKRKRKGPGYWTLERSVAVIPECETRTVFQKRYYQAYRLIKESGLLDKYYPSKEIKKRKWTIKKSAKIASLCRSRMELHKKYPGAYEILRKAGLLDELLPSRKYWEKYNDEEKMKIIANCKTKRELNDHYRSVYDWLRLSGRLDEFYPKRGPRKD